MELPIYNNTGVVTDKKQSMGSYDLSAGKYETVHPLVHQFVVMHLANQRHPIAHTKTRGEVNVSGRKLFRQKGTGNARVGDAGSPIRNGGGVAFGPTKDKKYSKDMTKKMKHLALHYAFLHKLHNDKVIVVDVSDKNWSTVSTRDGEHLVKNLSVPGSLLFVSDKENSTFNRSLRNIGSVETKDYRYVNSYDLMKYNTICICLPCVDSFLNRI